MKNIQTMNVEERHVSSCVVRDHRVNISQYVWYQTFVQDPHGHLTYAH